MAFPNGSRLRTYAPGDQILSADLNAMQDADIDAYNEIYNKRLVVRDHFTGQSISSSNWVTPTGTVTVVDDSANGGNGTAKLDASGGSIQLFETRGLTWSGDFTLRARMRVTAVNATCSVLFGINAGTPDNLKFLIDGPSSTTQWKVLINGVVTTANGTGFAVNATYADFEMKRAGTLVTLSINGVVFHTMTSGTYTGGTLRASISNSSTGGILWVDSVELKLA